MYAIAIYTNGSHELREADLFGWFYATGECKEGVDKAGFHAIGAIGGIDEQAKFTAIKKIIKNIDNNG